MTKSIRHSLLAGAATLVFSAALPIAALAENLADALVGAYSHSGALDQNRALLRAADEDVARSMAALRPILNWSANVKHTRSDTVSAGGLSVVNRTGMTIGYSAELLLYDGGSSKMAIEAAKEAVLATRQALVAAEQTVLLNAVRAYMGVRRDTEFVALRHNNVRVITQELRAAKDRFEVGEVTRTDVALAEARLASARSLLASSQGSLMSSKEDYKAAVGHKPGQLSTSVRLPKLPRSMDEAKAIAVRSHPDMKRIQHDISAAELQVRRAQSAMGPSIKLKGSLGVTNYLNSSASYKAGTASVELTAPIYQGGALSSALRRTMAQRDATRASLHSARHTIGQNVGSAWASLTVARASGQATDRQIIAARIAFRGVREEATLGARTTLDVLDAEQELLDAQANRISALVDEYTAAYTLLATMGHLTVDHLKLKVEKYDPAAYYNMVKNAPAILSKQGRQLDRVLRAIGKE